VKLVVLLKQVPRLDAIRFDENNRLERLGVDRELNPFDRFAIAHARRLRERAGGEVVALTMGPPHAEEALREALALGADRAIHLSDDVFAVADTIGTARTLALALRRENPDLVVCGVATTDSGTSQVPLQVAAFLDLPVVTSVVEIGWAAGGLDVRRETDTGYETYVVEPPCVLAVAAAPAGEAAAGAGGGDEIERWAAADLVDDLRPSYDKRFGQPGSPTRVLAVRTVTPERAGRRAASPDEAAELVLEHLAAAGQATATAWEKPDCIAAQPRHAYDCWSLVELRAGGPTRTSLELLAKGRELAGKLGGANVALVIGHGVDAAAGEAVRHGAERVVAVDDERLAEGHPEDLAAALQSVVERERPHVLLVPASALGRTVGPLVAGRLELGMTADCVGLGIDRAGRLIQTRPALGGNIASVIMGSTTPQLATVRPRMFAPLPPRTVDGVDVRSLALDGLPERRTRLVLRRDEGEAWRLDEADVVVGLGAGAERVEELETVAREWGAAVAGTPAAVEAGLVPRTRLVGALGRAVAPRVYVAVEAEDGPEHLTGIVKSAAVVALSSSGDDPLLDQADVALVGEPAETLPALLRRLGGRI
jgi:electron transfer flavoprotein alpha/beta subunit